MNAGLRKLFVAVVLLFLVLMAGTVRWTVVEAGDLNDNGFNTREAQKTQKVPRGTIRAADGQLLARSVKQPNGDYKRHYTQLAASMSQLIGYAFRDPGTSGMEKEHQDDLTGKVKSAATLLSALRGSNERGDDVTSTIEPKVQQAAITGMAGRKGAAVAIDVKTGGLLASVSLPNFDPNDMASKAGRARVNSAQGSPLLNRVTSGHYAPGSTFKVVTTTAALGTGKYTPETIVDGASPIEVQGQPLANFNNEQPGKITLTAALTHSVNTAFARVAEDIGAKPIADAMDAFGFGKMPLIDYPQSQMFRSGVRDPQKDDELLPVDGNVDIARVAIGQERLAVTPLQMGIVAATIARGGDRPKLSTIQKVTDPDGRQLWNLGDGKSAGRAMSEREAQQLTAMMEQVVNEGTGTAAKLSGISIAGKTGSAETNVRENLAQPWFIGFAPAENPKVAVAVTLESIVNGQGGIDAAPIAKAMIEAAL